MKKGGNHIYKLAQLLAIILWNCDCDFFGLTKVFYVAEILTTVVISGDSLDVSGYCIGTKTGFIIHHHHQRSADSPQNLFKRRAYLC